MLTKDEIKTSIEMLEQNVSGILQEIQHLKKLLAQPESSLPSKIIEDAEYQLQQNIEKFISFPLPDQSTFTILDFQPNIIPQLIDEAEDLLDKTHSREDAFEYSHLSNLINYLKALTDKKINAKYNVKELYEAGFHKDSPIKVIMDHREREEINNIIPTPYYARIDINDYEVNEKATYYIGLQGFDGKGQDQFLITNWETSIGELFEQKERYHNQLVNHPKLGKVKLTFARNIDIEQSQIIKLHKPIGETEFNEALIQKLASKHGVDMDIIVETIDAEQSDIIRMPINENEVIIIQGSAGSGKSAIALQRIRFLLTEYKNTIKSEDSIAFFGPNELFLKHIEKVLPRLGTYKVLQTTLSNYLGKIVGVNHFMNTHQDEWKTSLQYKNWIERKTNMLLNDLKLWNEDLVLDQDFVISALEMLEVADESLKLPYNDRKNFMIQMIEKKALESRRREEKLISTIRIKMDEFINEELKELFLEFPKNISNIEQLLSSEIISVLNKFAQQVKRDKKKNDPNEFFYSAVTEEAKQIQRILIPLLKTNFKNLLIKYEASMNRAAIIFHSQIKSSVNEVIDEMIAEKSKEFISSRISQHIHFKHPTLIVALDDFMKQPSTKRLIDNATEEFNRFYHASMEEELNQKFNELLNSFNQWWSFKFEERLNKLLREIYLKHEVALPSRTYNTEKPKEQQKMNTQQINSDIQKINAFVSTKWLKDEAEVLRRIYSTKSTDEDDFSKMKLGETFEQSDLPALFNIHIIMNGRFSKSLSYLIADEAQDYSPYELWCLTQLTTRKSFMLLGDLAQSIHQSNTFDTWEDYQAIFPNIKFYNLKKTYRSTKEIVEYCNRIIEPFSNGKFELPTTIYRSGPAVKEQQYTDILKGIKDYVEYLKKADYTYQTIAIICKNFNEAKRLYHALKNDLEEVLWQKSAGESIHSSLIIIEAALAKGLEFDCVIIPDLSVYQNTIADRKLAYVAASRALHELCVALLYPVHKQF
ncbi:UvrD-like helicase family protein [Ureibacillus xyleni]|uniref:UvrD-like helicase family protein n=1 Tax=Ureibacillus xyleni TaxID=614648 RepID=A0A285TK49_9BACL|nr:3'-5' exonuclease [Ureibacillus xyleni]SOC22759.1 UvrD-like helicase family protein [Ureibacillus xyleni]